MHINKVCTREGMKNLPGLNLMFPVAGGRLWDHVAEGAGGHRLQSPIVGPATAAKVAARVPALQVATAAAHQVTIRWLPAAATLPGLQVAGLVTAAAEIAAAALKAGLSARPPARAHSGLSSG
jgi:hypothetical protein